MSRNLQVLPTLTGMNGPTPLSAITTMAWIRFPRHMHSNSPEKEKTLKHPSVAAITLHTTRLTIRPTTRPTTGRIHLIIHPTIRRIVPIRRIRLIRIPTAAKGEVKPSGAAHGLPAFHFIG